MLVPFGGIGQCVGTSRRFSIESTLTFWVTIYLPSLSFIASLKRLDDALDTISSVPHSTLTRLVSEKRTAFMGTAFFVVGRSSSESRTSITVSRVVIHRLLGEPATEFKWARLFKGEDLVFPLVTSSSNSSSLEISITSCAMVLCSWIWSRSLKAEW